jgi:hypothetical protein
MRYLKKPKFRSKFEEKVYAQLSEVNDSEISYESIKLKYTPVPKEKTYTPDIIIKHSTGHIIYLELKGYFRTSSERIKYEHVKKSNPDIDLRFIFQNSKLPIYKGSPTTYAGWADKNNFPWADKIIPTSWKTA